MIIELLNEADQLADSASDTEFKAGIKNLASQIGLRRSEFVAILEEFWSYQDRGEEYPVAHAERVIERFKFDNENVYRG